MRPTYRFDPMACVLAGFGRPTAAIKIPGAFETIPFGSAARVPAPVPLSCKARAEALRASRRRANAARATTETRKP